MCSSPARPRVEFALSRKSAKRTVRLIAPRDMERLLTLFFPGIILSQKTQRPLLDLLFRTYPLYIDRPSRLAVQQCLRSVLRSTTEKEDLEYLAGRLRNECSKSSLAPACAFVLVEWCSIVLQHLCNDAQAPLALVLDVISADAKALETCLEAATKQPVKESAIRVTRRALRAVFSSESWGEEAIRESVTRLTGDSASAQRNAPFLGVISGVSARLQARRHVLEGLKKPILTFYAKEILGSRTSVPAHIADGLSDFFSSFATHEDLKSEVFPTLEKAILRSPEVVLGGLIPPLCSSIPQEIDLSEVVYSRLVKPLLSSLKSSNPVIRQGAAQSFESLISKCRSEDWLLKVIGEIIGPLKTQKISNAEQRALHAQVLSSIPCFVNLSQEVVQGLVPVSSRESSEVALEPELKAVCKHLTHLVQSKVALKDDIITTISKGSGDKRVPFRKVWQLNIGEVLWKIEQETLVHTSNVPFVKQMLAKLKDSFNEVVANPLPSAQSGLVSIAYVFLALCGRLQESDIVTSDEWANIAAQSVSLTPKPSFLLNPKVYTKLTSEDDFRWKTRALAAIATKPGIRSYDSTTKGAWGQAFVYVIASPGVPARSREAACRTLSEVYLKDADTTGAVISDAVWTWILSLETAEKESAAVAAGANSQNFLHLVIKAICPRASDIQASGQAGIELTLKNQLLNNLVLCRSELIPKLSWIESCLRTGTDPGKLVSERPDECIQQLTRVMEVRPPKHLMCAVLSINPATLGSGSV